MEKSEKDFLKDKYWNKKDFRKAVEKSAEKAARLAGSEDVVVPQKPQEQISHYLDRIQDIAGKKGELFREMFLYPKYIIKPENISDTYIKSILFGNFAAASDFIMAILNLVTSPQQKG